MEISERVAENNIVPEIKKEKKPGIIYLNYIPRYMTVVKVREYFSEFGEVKRLFLKPEKSKKPGKPSKFFSEGWIEFSSRKSAKRVAECLNGVQVGGKRRTPYYDALWSIKYLPKVQWSQLNEDQAYTKAKKEQRMRAEIAKIKREVNFYTESVARMKRLKKSGDKKVKQEQTNVLKRRTEALQNFQSVKNISPKNKSSDNRQLLLLQEVFGGNVNE